MSYQPTIKVYLRFMEIIRITNQKADCYPEFRELYETSFPIFEQRTKQQQQIAFDFDNYHLDLYYDNSKFIGFLSYWEFDNYFYVEHFAINTTFRGTGHGSQILRAFIENKEKIILLEIDPLVDEVSEARFRFYKKCGFFSNEYSHTHPPYRKGYTSHQLIVLTTQREITEKEYLQFSKDLNTIVMRDN